MFITLIPKSDVTTHKEFVVKWRGYPSTSNTLERFLENEEELSTGTSFKITNALIKSAAKMQKFDRKFDSPERFYTLSFHALLEIDELLEMIRGQQTFLANVNF